MKRENKIIAVQDLTLRKESLKHLSLAGFDGASHLLWSEIEKQLPISFGRLHPPLRWLDTVFQCQYIPPKFVH